VKTLSTPITTQRDATQSGWSELYDFYLKASITTPFGTTNVLRICTNPAGVSFFTPKISPEPAGTQGSAQTYSFWPLKRQLVKGSSKFSNDKLNIAASNVSQDWAKMLAAVDWESVPVVIRKVSNTISNPTAEDCAVIFSGSIDAVKITVEQLQFTVSNDFGTFTLMAPRENMHANCRFNYGDDQCTQLLYAAANYKTKTVGSGSTTTNVKSAGLTEDTGSSGSYGADLVNPLLDTAITSSSENGAIAGAVVTFTHTVAPKTGIVRSWFNFASGSYTLPNNAAIKFAGTLPTGLVAGTTYYIKESSYNGYSLSFTPGGSQFGSTSDGSGTITLSTVSVTFSAYQVKSSYPEGYWEFQDASDWGSNSQGYWTTTAGAGLRAPGLTPFINFDFGSNVSPKLWRVCGRQDADREALPRMLLFFSSSTSNFSSDVQFEGYFACPPQFSSVMGSSPGPQLFDVLLPNARIKRYWRICVRSRWSDTLRYPLLYKVYAYTGSRHYWQDAQITFASGTTTAALRNVTRTVTESYAGELICAALPTAPVSGDTFVIQRGCARTFNACCARRNWENFGGFDSMPFETVIR
jgi:phage-related protein